MSISEIHLSIKKICEKVDGNSCFSTAKAQIDYILSNYLKLKRDFHELFVPAIEAEISKTRKSFDEAQRFKQFVDLYKNMAEPQFVDKAFENINKSIISTPTEKRNFLFRCFAQRSNMHYNQNDYKASLKDIDHALQIRLSYSLIDRRVKIMNKLNHLSEAYQFVADIIRKNEVSLSDEKLKLFRKLKKDLKKYKSNKTKSEMENLNEILQGQLSVREIQIDPRVRIKKNLAERYNFIAKEQIPPNTEILSEEPIILTFSSIALHKYCNNCRVKVVNTFWPCSQCREIVFCSQKCAEQATEYHQAECGLITLMQQKLCNQAVQVYRTFIQLNQLFKKKEKTKIFSLEDYLENLNTEINISQANKWFFANQSQIFQRISKRKPLHRALELCNAIFLFMIYCYKMDFDVNDISKKDMIQMIEFLATSIIKTQINEYSWYEVNEFNEKVIIGNYQCLFGSAINHQCDPNAEWSFDGTKFLIKTTKHIENDEEIAITYGVSKDLSLLKRQRYLQNLCIMCCCARCMKEVRETSFAIRCEYCHGPIPYDSNEYINEVCIICERNYESPAAMLMLQNQFQSVKRAICLVGLIDENYLKNVEDMMTTLACYVYLQSDQFIEMVCKLCDRYFNLQMWSEAIEWYQWFVDVGNIHLSYANNDLVYYRNLDKWSNAYMNYLEQKICDGKEIKDYYIETAAHLFEEKLKILESLEDQCNLQVFDQLQFRKLFKSSVIETHEKYCQFQQVCYKILKLNNGEDRNMETISRGMMVRNKKDNGDDEKNKYNALQITSNSAIDQSINSFSLLSLTP